MGFEHDIAYSQLCLTLTTISRFLLQFDQKFNINLTVSLQPTLVNCHWLIINIAMLFNASPCNQQSIKLITRVRMKFKILTTIEFMWCFCFYRFGRCNQLIMFCQHPIFKRTQPMEQLFWEIIEFFSWKISFHLIALNILSLRIMSSP